MIDHGLFEAYAPAADNPILMGVPGAIFARRMSDGADWYDLQSTFEASFLKLVLNGNEITSASYDGTTLSPPVDRRLVEIDLPGIADAGTLLRKHFVNGEIIEAPSVSGPTILPAGVFFDRTTEDEAEAIDGAMMAQPVKFRRAWAAATVFRSDNDLWPVLRAAIVSLYGEARADELLAAPNAEMMMATPAA